MPRKYTKNFDDGFFDEDSMPTPCDCGNWFDLHDGYGSKHSNRVICEECHQKEEQEDEE